MVNRLLLLRVGASVSERHCSVAGLRLIYYPVCPIYDANLPGTPVVLLPGICGPLLPTDITTTTTTFIPRIIPTPSHIPLRHSYPRPTR